MTPHDRTEFLGSLAFVILLFAFLWLAMAL
jgi:hypothetical protein